MVCNLTKVYHYDFPLLILCTCIRVGYSFPPPTYFMLWQSLDIFRFVFEWPIY